ncbi:serine protease nudel isoform X3 [Megachile rotundata]|uniref:serine protease nudel isoform X3 n=1 Tax=Megachile rotundata TaxID=143995 RepID=UPI003FD2C8CB
MDIECEIPSKERLPIVEGQCCVNLSTISGEVHRQTNGKSIVDSELRRNRSSRKRGNCSNELLYALSIMCLATFVVYLIITSGYSCQSVQNVSNKEIDQREELAFDVSVPEEQTTKSIDLDLREYYYKHQLPDMIPELRAILLNIDQNRLKRNTGSYPCNQNTEHCKTVIDSMLSIVNIVNNSIPHLQPFLANFTSKSNSTKSQFIELVECLQCKSGPQDIADQTTQENIDNGFEHFDHAQIKNNVEVVNNLLNDEDQDDQNKHSSSNSVIFTAYEEQSAKKSTVSILDKSEEYSGETTEEARTTSTIETTGYGSMSKETEVYAAATSTSTSISASSASTTKADEATTQTERIDDTMWSTIIANAMAKLDGDNATETTNDTVHPSDQGHGEWSAAEREGENASKSSRKSNASATKERIVFNDQFQNKPTMDSAPGMIPTAETMKSTQQLQLTPTMSWMPYQVCFYGPSMGATKQSAPSQSMYPASSPGAAYPIPMSQQRPNNQNPMNQPANYFQVQAQSVQFLPMQPFPGNFGAQRPGPTGPGPQSFPMFPGHQIPSGGANPSAKSSYYCTYIPAPTFQFPTIPGVSDYQRSSDKEDGSKEKEYPEPCPFSMIRCGDGKKCILRSQWCNGQVDCMDASDETTCSCRDRISQERLCDGYFDCPHGEDELGCLGCPKTSFSCNDWNKRFSPDNCLPLSQRCDGIEQCSNGKDEVDCSVLTPSYIGGKNAFMTGYTKGYLHKNFNGQWYPVCTAVDSWAKDACIAEIGIEIDEVPTIQIHSMSDDVYQGPFLTEVDGQPKLIPSCMNTAVYVECPPFACGTPVAQNSLQSTSEETDQSSRLLSGMLRPWSENEIDWRTNNDRNSSKEDDIVGSQLRVVGGRASQPTAWPFLVAIYKDGRFHCGGIILNDLWILTAAHCVDGYKGHYYEIQAGMLRRFSFSPMSQFRKARYAIAHPSYSGRDMTNDIGMIMLDDSLRFNRWVRPVCLPERDILGSMWRVEPEPGSTCLAIGWGATSERGPDPDHLREVEVPILKHCKYETDQIAGTICAGYPQGGRDACQGDSGGPLMCRNPYSQSQWYVAGIVSHGEGCGRPNEPGAYTKVSYFLSWIKEVSNSSWIPPLRRTPLTECPGFSCKGGLGTCLPAAARCNRIIDCLDGEDELNCHLDWNRSFSRKVDDIDSDTTSSPVDSSTSQQILNGEFIGTRIVNFSIDKGQNALDTEVFEATDRTLITEEQNNEVIFDNTYKSTTYSSIESEPSTVEIDSAIDVPTTFTCGRLLQSIPINKRCNREADCEDSTDEMNCTCKDYLSNLKPTAICDGYLDCDDKTDEQDCEICSKDQFFCKNSRVCISSFQKCDGHFDCKFKEDELDCFTLTDGHHVYLDADERPFLNTHGVLTRNVDGKWQTTCHKPKMLKNQWSPTLIGQNMCEYFGFQGMKSSFSITVKNVEMETIKWDKENATQQNIPIPVSREEEDKTCPGLNIRCTPVFSSSISTYLTIDSSTGNHVHLWPWLAAIFVDGEYRCSALLLDHHWLLSASKCVENVRLDQNYATAVLGYGPLFRHVDGPHQTVSTIDEVQHVNNSESVLLHLKHRVDVSRHVQPLFLNKTIYLPGVNDTCVAVGTNEKYETQSIFLKTVLQNCKTCHRCFVNSLISECSENETSNWSGVVFCQGRKGWYPAATFQDHEGPCSFREPQTLTGIDHISPYLVEAIDGKRQSIEATCEGFRCSIGQCIPKDRVCDGVPDCRDSSDENPKYCEELRDNCENRVDGCNCAKSELRCGNGRCVDKSAFCNGVIDCSDGSDEPTICTCAHYLRLTNPGRLCDGVRHCYDKTDESPELCPCGGDKLKCRTNIGNDTCIPQDFICDGEKDCIDGEDEAKCRMLKQFSDDSNGSGEVIRQSYGVWHTECFPNPISSEEASNLCEEMGYSSGDISNETITTEELMIPKRDEFYLVRLNYFSWMTLRNDKPLITLVKSNDTCHRAFVDCI